MTILLYELVGRDAGRPFSPHCWKVALALAHKGLEFDRIPVPFTDIGAVENGVSRTVPVIRDGDKVRADSFEIAVYLDESYPDRPTLFGGPGGQAMARFVERWSQLTLHPYIGASLLADLHDMLAAPDQAYFRGSREKRYGRPIEEVPDGRDAGLAGFRASLAPLRSLLEDRLFIGGATPLFADYIVFSAFQWARIASPFTLVADGDPVAAWIERCLDLHGRLARSVAPA